MLKVKMLGFLLVLMLVLSACRTAASGENQAGEAESQDPTRAGEQPEVVPTEINTDRMLPVPIDEGLASLDSYRMTYINDVYDSVPDQRSVITFVVAHDKATDANYNSSETQVTTEDYEIISSQIQEQYVIGNEICMLANGQAQFTAMSDMARQLTNYMSQGLQFDPPIENPVYTGDEMINGLPVRTYDFKVTSANATSDAEVARAEGHYALADDGDYLVDYRLDMELRTAPESDPEAEYSVSFFDLELVDINQGTEIVFPEACLNAKALSQGGF